MSFVTRITMCFGSCSFKYNAALMILWSFFSAKKTCSALINVGWLSIAILNFPRSFPNEIHSWSEPLIESLSINRITSLAQKFLVSLPTLNLSSSSNTVIGMVTLLFLKFVMAWWSCRRTEVSSTNIFSFFNIFFL